MGAGKRAAGAPGEPAAAEPEQLALVRPRPPRTRPRAATEPAATAPIARVAVDIALPHLDRPFDYLVTAAQDAAARPGARVRVRFAGQLVDGFLLDRVEISEHVGRLARLERVLSPESVLTPAVARLARAVADRYGGVFADVVRLAVPPRHARAEAAAPEAPVPDAPPVVPPGPEAWAAYTHGPAFLAALARGESPRAVLAALPGATGGAPAWADQLAQAAVACAASGRRAVLCVPDQRAIRRAADACRAAGLEGVVELAAEMGPQARYTAFLAALRGQARVVVGPRSAAFAPVADLGLVACWDDGDDLHSEPRAPYPHVLEVLALRAHLEGSAFLVAGHAVTAEGALLVSSRWARPLAAPRAPARAAWPRVRTVGSDADLAADPQARTARLPHVAWLAAHEALRSGPVLVQVPRRGYLPALACARCRRSATCAACGGPLGLGGGGAALPACAWCARSAGAWQCPGCGGTALRAQAVGARRTAEELGRAFPSVTVRTSGRHTGPGAAGDGVLDTVPGRPALVVATPGAEPVAEGGYAAALLLDGDALLGRRDLRAEEEALRRWLNAASLVRPAAAGGVVVVVADPARAAVQALVRADPAGFAARELAARTAADLPPAARVAAVTGPRDAVEAWVAEARLPAAAEVLGPAPLPGSEESRALIRCPRSAAAELSAAVHAAQAARSARRAEPHVRVVIDPVALG